MKTEEIIEIQTEIGTLPDGFWGRKSIAAAQAFLLGLMPTPNPWPETDQASLQAFYGSPGDEEQLVSVPAPVPMFYEGTQIKTFRCHHRVAPSLVRAIVAAYQRAPEVIGVFDGCYANRLMRGGSLVSLHARGAAIDFDAERNGNHVSWPTAARMPWAVMKCFAVEGWISAGAFWGRDAMHHQATQ